MESGGRPSVQDATVYQLSHLNASGFAGSRCCLIEDAVSTSRQHSDEYNTPRKPGGPRSPPHLLPLPFFGQLPTTPPQVSRNSTYLNGSTLQPNLPPGYLFTIIVTGFAELTRSTPSNPSNRDGYRFLFLGERGPKAFLRTPNQLDFYAQLWAVSRSIKLC